MTQQIDRSTSQVEPENGNSPAIVKWRGAEMIVTHDEGQFQNFLDTAKFAQLYRISEMFAASKLVPEHFRGNASDCFIGCQMAMRLGVDPLMFLQKTYIVHGKPGMEATLAIALINSSGLFKNSLDYEVQGDDPFHEKYRVRAMAEPTVPG